MTSSSPIHPDAAWLYEPAQATYPGRLTQAALMTACAAAAVELGIRRKRTPAQREALAENIRHLLREVFIREQPGTSLGSLHWDLSHGQLPLSEAAARALDTEYRRGRYRVLQWALHAVLGPDAAAIRQAQLLVESDGKRVPIGVLSQQGDEGHAAAIRHLARLMQRTT